MCLNKFIIYFSYSCDVNYDPRHCHDHVKATAGGNRELGVQRPHRMKRHQHVKKTVFHKFQQLVNEIPEAILIT